MHVNLKQIEAFIWVADLGSFRRAADRLNTTQPNISARISALESLLDVTLMERDAGSVRLTRIGEEILASARDVMRAADSFIETANRQSLIDNTLKLGVTELIAYTWLRDYLKAVREHFPNLIVELTVDLAANLEKELSRHAVDLTLQNGLRKGRLEGDIDLGSYAMTWVAATQIGLEPNAKISMEELASYPILTHARHASAYQELQTWFRTRRDLTPRFVSSNSLSASLHMAADGMGVAVVPRAMASRELTSGELFEFDPGWVPEDLHFFARFHPGKSARFVQRAAQLAQSVSATHVENLP